MGRTTTIQNKKRSDDKEKEDDDDAEEEDNDKEDEDDNKEKDDYDKEKDDGITYRLLLMTILHREILLSSITAVPTFVNLKYSFIKYLHNLEYILCCFSVKHLS